MSQVLRASKVLVFFVKEAILLQNYVFIIKFKFFFKKRNSFWLATGSLDSM